MAFEIPLEALGFCSLGCDSAKLAIKLPIDSFDFARETAVFSVPVRLRYNIFDSPIYAIAGPESYHFAVSTHETSF
jgi:hypothetical protein